ncbi:MAG: hypothetical protein MRJ96_00190 [Nitrospirales bacterium]|nr:hypothetical protein [Nitrospira sp.]MDR4499859.1 hypothetical protein [Nitrospirales bacterium]
MSDEATSEAYTVLNVMGPYREPRETAFSFDYSVERPHWATPQGVRVKVYIEEELEYCKGKVLAVSGGSVGQQLRVNQIIAREIADQKLEIGNRDGLFSDRRDVMIGPFRDELAHLAPQLENWMQEHKERIRREIHEKVGL